MPHVKTTVSLIALLGLVACTSNAPVADTKGVKTDFASFLTKSCPDDVSFVLPEKIALTTKPVGWNDAEPSKLSPMKGVQVYEIESEDSRIGGLSGLDFLDDDTLILVTDQGDLVWLDVDVSTGKPADAAYITFLKSADGKPLDGKTQGDAEGIAWNGEYAYVSFERDHRILGYDIEGCGANARGIEVIRFSESDFGTSTPVKPNGGLEALTDFGDGLLAGLETRVNDAGGMSYIRPAAAGSFNISLPLPDVTLLVGAEVIAEPDGSGRIYVLTRSYDPFRGNTTGIVTARITAKGEMSDPEVVVHFGKPITVDNFEGIAVRRLSDGTDRMFIISDDNFSPKQRTLLGVLDYTPD